MRQAEYLLITYGMSGVQKKETVVGTRLDARVRCRRIDEETYGQVTKIRFVRYT